MMVRAAEDYYDTLGVSKTADKKEIKSAYRQKARRLQAYGPTVKLSVVTLCLLDDSRSTTCFMYR